MKNKSSNCFLRAWMSDKAPLSRRSRHESSEGFVMTTVIFMMAIMAVIAYAALLQASNGLNLAYKQSYIQMARMASKAAVDYAQEKFDSASCGNYTGTSEQDLVSNGRYRITFKADVVSTSTDGYEKTIKGTGSVYLPRLSNSAQYVFDIRSQIIRTYALCKTPADFGPLEWLDASDTTKLLKLITGSTITSQGGLGILDLVTPNDTVEEKVTDGSQGTLSWLSDDIEMHTCDPLEFVLACSGTMANKDLYDGFVFQNVNIPKGYTINSATIQLSGANPSGSGGATTSRFYGLYNTANNPHLPLFNPLGTNQVRPRITNASLRTTQFTDTTINNFPPGNATVVDVTAIVQEMVNNANWNPNSNGGRIGFGAQRQSGSGSHKACKGNIVGGSSCNGKGPKLTITYTANASSPSANGDSLFEWDPVTGWGVPAKSAYGNQPTRVDNQINGKTIVRFNNGTLLAALTSALTSHRELTVLAVVKPNFATSSADGRVISGMTSTGTNDTSGSNAIIPLLRDASSSGFSNLYSGSAVANRNDYICGGTCTSTPYIFVGSFTIDTTNNTITSVLKGNGQTVATKTGINPGGSPYTWGIDQLYIGGRRNGTMAAGSGTNYFNGDYAELVIYDKALQCRQIEALEEYLRNKWAISGSPYASTCPDEPIPTL